MMADHEYLTLGILLEAVRDCRACEGYLPLGPRPGLGAAATVATQVWPDRLAAH